MKLKLWINLICKEQYLSVCTSKFDQDIHRNPYMYTFTVFYRNALKTNFYQLHVGLVYDLTFMCNRLSSILNSKLKYFAVSTSIFIKRQYCFYEIKRWLSSSDLSLTCAFQIVTWILNEVSEFVIWICLKSWTREEKAILQLSGQLQWTQKKVGHFPKNMSGII